MSNDVRPMFSVLILNWNGANFLPRCLDSVQGQTFQDFEVLVLDNASTDGSLTGAETRWPTFRFLRFKQNLGFAAANNRGAEMARGEWLAFLNNDSFPDPGWLMAIDESIHAHPEYTFFSSRIMVDSPEDRVQSSGDVYNISGCAWSRDNHFLLDNAHRTAEEVFSPCAAAAVYRRDIFIEAGGFDEDFVSHHEDVDLGFRLRLLGYRCLYIPDAVVRHIGSASFGSESSLPVYRVQRNFVWCYLTNMPGKLLWKFMPAHLLANLVFLVYYSFNGQAKAVWRARWDAWRSIPAILRKRKQIQKKCRVDPAQIERILDRQWLNPYRLGKRFGKRMRLE